MKLINKILPVILAAAIAVGGTLGAWRLHFLLPSGKGEFSSFDRQNQGSVAYLEEISLYPWNIYDDVVQTPGKLESVKQFLEHSYREKYGYHDPVWSTVETYTDRREALLHALADDLSLIARRLFPYAADPDRSITSSDLSTRMLCEPDSGFCFVKGLSLGDDGYGLDAAMWYDPDGEQFVIYCISVSLPDSGENYDAAVDDDVLDKIVSDIGNAAAMFSYLQREYKSLFCEENDVFRFFWNFGGLCGAYYENDDGIFDFNDSDDGVLSSATRFAVPPSYDLDYYGDYAGSVNDILLRNYNMLVSDGSTVIRFISNSYGDSFVDDSEIDPYTWDYFDGTDVYLMYERGSRNICGISFS